MRAMAWLAAMAVQLQAPVGDRAKVGVEAEQRDERVAVHVEGLPRGRVLDGHGLDRAVAPHTLHLGRDADAHGPLLLELARLLHGRLERAEALPPVDERDREPGSVLEPERPVERRVAASDDHARLPAEDVLAADEVVEAASFPLVDVLDLALARL